MAESIAQRYRPGPDADPSTVVMSYYPFNGNEYNTGPRYQEEATLTGFDVVGIHRLGSNTLRYSPSLRGDLSPEHFDETCADDADVLEAIAKNYDRVIWRGQSTGGFPTLSVVKSELVKATHLVLEDGINLRHNPNGKPVGAWKARWEWYQQAQVEGREMPDPPVFGWKLPIDHQSPQSDAVTLAQLIIEQFHLSPLWRSNYSRLAALEIALGRPDLPMLVHFLGHSATGTQDEVIEMMDDLQAADDERKRTNETSARIHTIFDRKAWHGFLLYPQFGSANLKLAAAMDSHV